jgi:mannitol/fructose-specific phosphotransferase system IIA component (Ntr-type)
MITIADILLPHCVDLNLAQDTQEAAILHTIDLLRGDERVIDSQALLKAVLARDPGIAGGQAFDICIPHARTNAVESMVMAAGRSVAGIPRSGGGSRIHYIFVIGVPVQMASDYLRIIGALARIFRDEETEQQLRAAATVGEFVGILQRKEMAL